MGGLLRYLTLSAQARTGFSGGILIWAAIASFAALLAAVFLVVAAFVWLSERYSTLTAALVLAFLFLVLALIALVACLLTRRSNVQQARVALAERGGGPFWFDPKLMATGFQLGQSIGWRKLASLGAVAVLAAVIAREWLGGGEQTSVDEEHGDE
ncbi:MAG: hypothetical protein IT537_15670 [Hyphomicrobiales bacterium]|nr:hypothetical protein [Hyphomicrobiales bacterium]